MRCDAREQQASAGLPPPPGHRAPKLLSCAHAQADLALKAAAGTFRLGRAPKETSLPAMQRFSIGSKPTTPSAATVRARRAFVLHLIARDSERRRACPLFCASARWRPQMACRTTAARRRRQVFRSISPVHRPSIGPTPITASAARRARATSSHGAPSPQRWRAQAPFLRKCASAQVGLPLEAAAAMSQHGRAPKERGLSLVQCPSLVYEPTITRAARRARAASKRAAPPPESWPAQWHSRACHADVGCALEAAPGTSHHGLAPKERGLPSVQYLVVRHGSIATSAARCARAASACATPPPYRQPAQWRARVSHAEAGCAKYRLQLACRTMVLHRRRELFRWCSALS